MFAGFILGFVTFAPCSRTVMHAAPSAATLKHLIYQKVDPEPNYHTDCWKPPPHVPFVLITSQVFKCARSPTVSSVLSPLLIGNVGRIMENYPVYKKPLKSRGAPLPNDTESNYRMFQHPVHRKGSRGPLSMRMRLIWFKLPYPAAAQSRPRCHHPVYSVCCV